METILVSKINSGAYMPRESYKGCYDLYLPLDTEIKEGWNIIPLGFSLDIPSGIGMLVGCAEENILSGYTDKDEIKQDIEVVSSFVPSEDCREVCVSVFSYGEFVLPAGTLIASARVVSTPDVELKEV